MSQSAYNNNIDQRLTLEVLEMKKKLNFKTNNKSHKIEQYRILKTVAAAAMKKGETEKSLVGV